MMQKSCVIPSSWVVSCLQQPTGVAARKAFAAVYVDAAALAGAAAVPTAAAAFLGSGIPSADSMSSREWRVTLLALTRIRSSAVSNSRTLPVRVFKTAYCPLVSVPVNLNPSTLKEYSFSRSASVGIFFAAWSFSSTAAALTTALFALVRNFSPARTVVSSVVGSGSGFGFGTASLLVSVHVVAARHRALTCHGSGRVWP